MMKKNNFKKLLFFVLIASMMLVTVACGTESEETDNSNDVETDESSKEKITLRYADSQPEGYPSVEAAEEFGKIVSDKTDGRIEIKVYAGGQLGDEKSNIEQLRFGGLDLARVSIGPLAEFAPSLNVLQLPYLFRDSDHMWQVADGEIGKELLGTLEEGGVIGLTWYDAGSRNFYTKEEVNSLDDLDGMKIRVMESELMIDMAESLEVNPTPMNSGEVYSSLQSGVIEGAENNIPTYVANAHNEVAPYFTKDEHIRIPEPLLISKQVMEELSEEDQEIIYDAAIEASKIQRELWKTYEEESIKKAEEDGTVFIDLSAEKKQEFQDACEPMYEKYSEGYEDLVERILSTK